MRKLNIVDIGARGGAQQIWNNLRFPVQVIGFEPDKTENFNTLSDGTTLTKNTSLKIFPTAIYNKTTKKTLYIYKDARLSSFLLPNRQFLDQFPIFDILSRNPFKINRKIKVNCFPLDKFLKKQKIHDVDVLKIDTQGTELQILFGASKTLKSVFCINVEAEFSQIYKNQPLFSDIDNYLRKKGFVLFDLQRHWWKRKVPQFISTKGQIIFADALYFKNLNDKNIKSFFYSEKNIKNKLLKILIILSHLKFNDYAYKILHQAASAKIISKKDFSELKTKFFKISKLKNFTFILIQKIENAIYFFARKLNLSHFYFLNKNFYDSDQRH